MENSRIAVVILNWNGARMMKQFLPRVIAACGTDGAVIVADNGSTDDSVDMLRHEFPDVRLILLSENYGFAEGYNRALAQVEAEYFLLLNSDVEPDEGWLRPMLEYMDAHPETAACQPKLLNYRERHCFEYAGAAGGYIDRYGYPFCRGRVLENVEEDGGQYDTVVPLFWATGAALMVRSVDWKSAGGLDARFFAHQEEIDLCWRLRSRGRGIVCIPASRAWHVGGASLDQSNPRKTFLNFRNNLAMLYKNLPDDELHHVLRVRRWLDLVAMLKFFLTGEFGHARAVCRGRKAFREMRPSLADDRRQNLEAAMPAPIPERTDYLLLARYYLKGQKTFDRLEPYVK